MSTERELAALERIDPTVRGLSAGTQETGHERTPIS